MSKSNVVALFTAIPAALSPLAIELVKLRAQQDAKADLHELTTSVFTIFSAAEAGEVTTPEPEESEKKQTAAQKKKADAEAKKKADAAKKAGEEASGAKKKPAGKAKEIDLTAHKAQVSDFLEWLGDDKADEITAVLEEFGAETADDIEDENYVEFYKLIRALADAEFDLSEVEDLAA